MPSPYQSAQVLRTTEGKSVVPRECLHISPAHFVVAPQAVGTIEGGAWRDSSINQLGRTLTGQKDRAEADPSKCRVACSIEAATTDVCKNYVQPWPGKRKGAGI